MDHDIKIFLECHRVGVLSLALPNGMIHGAAEYYSFKINPFEFFFSTFLSSRKCLGILNGNLVNGPLVIGFQEKEWITFQADGVVQLVNDKKKIADIKVLHMSKFLDNRVPKEEEEDAFLQFSPQWWRYSDYSENPRKIVNSEI